MMSAHAFLVFLGHLIFWMGMFKVFRWNGLEILIPKHMWKSKIRPLELKKDKKSPKYLFFRDTLYNVHICYIIFMLEVMEGIVNIVF